MPECDAVEHGRRHGRRIQGDSTPAVVAAIIVTLSILVGATTIAAIPNLRTSSLVLAVCGIAALVLLSGSIVLGSAENKEVKSAEPPGRPSSNSWSTRPTSSST